MRCRTRRRCGSKLYHIYRDPSVSEDLNRRERRAARGAAEAGAGRLHAARRGLARDARQWQEAGHHSPPVMLTVCNRTETAARIEHYFNKGDAHWPELHAPEPDAARRLQGAREGRDRRDRQVPTRTTRARLQGDHRGGRPAGDTQAAAPGTEEGRAAARDRGQRRQAGRSRPGPAERHLGRDAVGRLGREERHPHHGSARVHQPAAVRAGRSGAGCAASSYDTGRERAVPARIRQRVRRAAVDLPGVGEGGEAPPPPKPSTQIEVAARACNAGDPLAERAARRPDRAPRCSTWTGPRWSR